MASETPLFLKHWIDINPERLARYETMYQWSAVAETFHAPAEVRAGQVVVDFGCGPGYTAMSLPDAWEQRATRTHYRAAFIKAARK
jgi:hypothetical protein